MCDSAGPFYMKEENDMDKKVYVLIFTCMFTRAVNLYVCPGMDTESFLYSLQLHILEYGMIQQFISDNQPSFLAGLNQ